MKGAYMYMSNSQQSEALENKCFEQRQRISQKWPYSQWVKKHPTTGERKGSPTWHNMKPTPATFALASGGVAANACDVSLNSGALAVAIVNLAETHFPIDGGAMWRAAQCVFYVALMV